MYVTAYRLRALKAPKDSLKEALLASSFKPREGDIVAISSKVVSIEEGRCVLIGSVEKEKLMVSEADWYLKPAASRWRRIFTIARGALIGSSGIDESNGSGHYVLYPEDPFRSARQMKAWLQRSYGLKKLGVIITDSTSLPLRRGAVGFALSWDGIDPLRDYRGTKDLFGRTIEIEMANLIDSLAAAAVLEMGEGSEQTPVAIIRGAKNIVFKNRSKAMDQLIVTPEDDLFAPLIWREGWKKGG
ncbi:MAG: coenzyme F420-0:L-glutamate ligase [Patescibacteria group bacterium]